MMFWKIRYKCLMSRSKRLYNVAEEILERIMEEKDIWWKQIRETEHQIYINKANKCRVKARRLEVRKGGWTRRKRWR